VIRIPLLLKTWRDHWRGLLAWCAGLIAMAVVQLSVYPSVAQSSSEMDAFLKNWPEVFQGFFALEDYTTGAGFLNIELFSLMVPLVFIAIAVSWGAGATADEERSGTADVLLALPVTRTSIIVTKMAATVCVLIARYLGRGPILGLLAAGPGMTVLPLSVMIEKVLSPGLVVLVDR
jgi:ABC-2 type transport system permease protein